MERHDTVPHRQGAAGAGAHCVHNACGGATRKQSAVPTCVDSVSRREESAPRVSGQPTRYLMPEHRRRRHKWECTTPIEHVAVAHTACSDAHTHFVVAAAGHKTFLRISKNQTATEITQTHWCTYARTHAGMGTVESTNDDAGPGRGSTTEIIVDPQDILVGAPPPAAAMWHLNRSTRDDDIVAISMRLWEPHVQSKATTAAAQALVCAAAWHVTACCPAWRRAALVAAAAAAVDVAGVVGVAGAVGSAAGGMGRMMGAMAP